MFRTVRAFILHVACLDAIANRPFYHIVVFRRSRLAIHRRTELPLGFFFGLAERLVRTDLHFHGNRHVWERRPLLDRDTFRGLLAIALKPGPFLCLPRLETLSRDDSTFAQTSSTYFNHSGEFLG
jgi:hypothetical protein